MRILVEARTFKSKTLSVSKNLFVLRTFGKQWNKFSRKLYSKFSKNRILQTEKIMNEKPNAQQAVWRQSGCMLAESLEGIWKFRARMNFCVPPPERQAAETLGASRATVQFEQRLLEKSLWLTVRLKLVEQRKWKLERVGGTLNFYLGGQSLADFQGRIFTRTDKSFGWQKRLANLKSTEIFDKFYRIEFFAESLVFSLWKFRGMFFRQNKKRNFRVENFVRAENFEQKFSISRFENFVKSL